MFTAWVAFTREGERYEHVLGSKKAYEKVQNKKGFVVYWGGKGHFKFGDRAYKISRPAAAKVAFHASQSLQRQFPEQSPVIRDRMVADAVRSYAFRPYGKVS